MPRPRVLRCLVSSALLLTIFLLALTFTVQLTDASSSHSSAATTSAASRLTRFRRAPHHSNSPRFAQIRAELDAAAAAEAAPAAASGGAAAPPPQSINVQVHTEMTDPVTKLLHSNWVWLIFAFFILILVCIILYCFREQVAICVACIETCLYHTIKCLLLPFKILIGIIRGIAYPVKQSCLAGKDRCSRYLYPAEMKVSGLRY